MVARVTSRRPSSQAISSLGIGRVETGGPGELQRSGRDREASARAHLGRARGAEFDVVEAPGVALGDDVAAQRGQRSAAERDAVDADADLHRDRRTRELRQRVGHAAQQRDRRARRRIRHLQRAIEIDLAGGQHPFELRLGAELQLGGAGELDGAIVRTVLEVDLLEQRGRGRRLDPARGAPWVVGEGLAAREREARRDA